MTAALFIVFLGKLAAGASRKIFLIVDRLKAHDAKAAGLEHIFACAVERLGSSAGATPARQLSRSSR
jgi:hypothetical protein